MIPQHECWPENEIWDLLLQNTDLNPNKAGNKFDFWLYLCHPSYPPYSASTPDTESLLSVRLVLCQQWATVQLRGSLQIAGDYNGFTKFSGGEKKERDSSVETEREGNQWKTLDWVQEKKNGLSIPFLLICQGFVLWLGPSCAAPEVFIDGLRFWKCLVVLSGWE